jgi:hypothetical protein
MAQEEGAESRQTAVIVNHAVPALEKRGRRIESLRPAWVI